VRHGFYCVGCCWTLMALLFVGGVMNILWIAAIAIFVLIERATPAGGAISRVAGAGMAFAGIWLLFK
jgi:predicted metal-binding membrane protein